MASIAKGIVEIGKVIVKNAGKVSKGAEQETKNVGEVARKAGPSGKPALHFIDKSSKKGAYEASKQAGKGEPIHHSNLSNGKPLYHPNNNPKDSKGLDKNIKKDDTHYTYPK